MLGEGETVEVKLDNDGNAFVVLLGAASCASGDSEIEASLVEAPYTTYTTNFTIIPPQAMEKPAFAIEKLQEIQGGAGYVTGPLNGKLGQTVDYEIVVRNTGPVAETFAEFTTPTVIPAPSLEVQARARWRPEKRPRTRVATS